MKSTRSRAKNKRAVKSLTPRKTDTVRGGRDDATGLRTGKRQHGVIVVTKA
jgi:hypothetical protein